MSDIDGRLHGLAQKTGVEQSKVKRLFTEKKDEIDARSLTNLSDKEIQEHAYSIVKNDLVNMSGKRQKEQREEAHQRVKEKFESIQPDIVPDVEKTVWQRMEYSDDSIQSVTAVSKENKKYPAVIPASINPLPDEWSWVELTFETDSTYPVVVDGSILPPWEDDA